jgi:hypothetical protein
VAETEVVAIEVVVFRVVASKVVASKVGGAMAGGHSSIPPISCGGWTETATGYWSPMKPTNARKGSSSDLPVA